MPDIFGTRAGFGMDASHVFPQGVLVTVSLIGYVVCVRGVFLTSQWLSAHRGEVCSPHAGSRSPEGQGQANSILFKCVLFLLPMLGPLERGILKEVKLIYSQRYDMRYCLFRHLRLYSGADQSCVLSPYCGQPRFSARLMTWNRQG